MKVFAEAAGIAGGLPSFTLHIKPVFVNKGRTRAIIYYYSPNELKVHMIVFGAWVQLQSTLCMQLGVIWIA